MSTFILNSLLSLRSPLCVSKKVHSVLRTMVSNANGRALYSHLWLLFSFFDSIIGVRWHTHRTNYIFVRANWSFSIYSSLFLRTNYECITAIMAMLSAVTTINPISDGPRTRCARTQRVCIRMKRERKIESLKPIGSKKRIKYKTSTASDITSRRKTNRRTSERAKNYKIKCFKRFSFIVRWNDIIILISTRSVLVLSLFYSQQSLENDAKNEATK